MTLLLSVMLVILMVMVIGAKQNREFILMAFLGTMAGLLFSMTL